MAMELVKEKWLNAINKVTIGSTAEEGGSRTKVVTLGGEETLPFLHAEGALPYKPVIAYEVWDTPARDWPEGLSSVYGKVLNEPFAWAKICVEEYKAELLCVRLVGAHPDVENRSVEEEADFIEKIRKSCGVPLIVVGCGDTTKDNALLPVCSQVLKGEHCLIGSVTQDNYKTITASCLADGHNIIAESPIDVNIAKQLNILISDMGMPLERIVIDPTVGALGYGFEYAYSIMERSRLAALAGDKMLAMPFICFVGQESWRAKEARTAEDQHPEWGAVLERGIIWEAVTAAGFLQAGADILVMRHPKAVEIVQKNIEELMGK
ncbi:MAG: acetyl-CoA decarbonylase/synthase complex subunit delta [Candidatus Omnitrophica bacterium]|nr:acetyl-CoA decarbonylase/synthase complex subunit delta [Candidatus Omnitrophota bacterium]MCM8770639.1 acetyl-CoA decarbonylase/synthase complex subunit delta [Candidatus Omnitrophota bacterium]